MSDDAAPMNTEQTATVSAEEYQQLKSELDAQKSWVASYQSKEASRMAGYIPGAQTLLQRVAESDIMAPDGKDDTAAIMQWGSSLDKLAPSDVLKHTGFVRTMCEASRLMKRDRDELESWKATAATSKETAEALAAAKVEIEALRADKDQSAKRQKELEAHCTVQHTGLEKLKNELQKFGGISSVDFAMPAQREVEPMMDSVVAPIALVSANASKGAASSSSSPSSSTTPVAATSSIDTLLNEIMTSGRGTSREYGVVSAHALVGRGDAPEGVIRF